MRKTILSISVLMLIIALCGCNKLVGGNLLEMAGMEFDSQIEITEEVVLDNNTRGILKKVNEARESSKENKHIKEAVEVKKKETTSQPAKAPAVIPNRVPSAAPQRYNQIELQVPVLRTVIPNANQD